MSQRHLTRSTHACRPLVLLAMTLFAATPAIAEDLALTHLLQPVSGCAAPGTENVTIRIFNHGTALPAGTVINMLYTVNAEPAVNQQLILADALGANSALIHTFAVPANLSAPGDYTMLVALQTVSDTNSSNNQQSNISISKSAASVGGTLSSPAAGASGTMTLSNHVGNVLQWEESSDQQRWFKLANNTDTQSYAGLTAPRHFRARVASAPCAAAVSNTVTAAP